MRASRLVLLAAHLATAATAFAQSPAPSPIARADLHGQIGWVSLDGRHLADWDDWDHGVAQGVVGFGWYWTDHLKTEAELSASSDAEFYGFQSVHAQGQSTYRSTLTEVGSAAIGVSQVYQFLRNAWCHPYVGGGLDVRRESRVATVEPVFVYDNVTRTPREIEPRRRIGPSVSYVVRPTATVGLKAYLSPRAFFRTDLRVAVREGVNEVVARFGFGLDF